MDKSFDINEFSLPFELHKTIKRLDSLIKIDVGKMALDGILPELPEMYERP